MAYTYSSGIADSLRGVNKKLSINTFYVDPVNGSDDNDGKSIDNAFATLQKAANMMPYGTLNIVYILNDLTVSSTSPATFTYKMVELRSHPSNENAKLTLSVDSATYPIKGYHKSYIYLKIDVEAQNNYDDTARAVIDVDSDCYCRTYVNYGKTANAGSNQPITVNIGDNSGLVYYRNSRGGFEYVNAYTTDTNSWLCIIGYTSTLYFSSTAKLNDQSMADASVVKPKIRNIVYDADSGNPINLISNINLSN